MIWVGEWTDARTDQLIVLYDKGLSASQIAQEFGDISRNAICGKIFRMKLSRPTPDRQPKPRAPRKPRKSKSKESRFGNWTTRPENMAAPSSFELTEVVADPLNLSFADISPMQCRWITSGDGEATTFCGHRTFYGSWCPTHRSAVFTTRTADRGTPALVPA